MGCSKLIGMDWMLRSRSVKANSIRCSTVSPMPMMPPQQRSIPTRRAACKVFSFCSCVCVVQSESKWEGAVSRLQWYRVTPASYNACNSSSSNSPSEAHNRIDEWRRIRRAATQSSFMFLGEGLRPLVTNEKRLTPCASLYFACRRHSSALTRSYTSALVL